MDLKKERNGTPTRPKAVGLFEKEIRKEGIQ